MNSKGNVVKGDVMSREYHRRSFLRLPRGITCCHGEPRTGRRSGQWTALLLGGMLLGRSGKEVGGVGKEDFGESEGEGGIAMVHGELAFSLTRLGNVTTSVEEARVGFD